MTQRDDTSTSHAADAALHLRYQGWSGCAVRPPEGSHASPLVFDPSPGVELEGGALTLLLTHGHFEHVDGALAHLRRREREPVTVVASSPLCQFLERRAARPGDRLVPVGADSRVEANGWEIRVFEWVHMPLLPPGAGPAARYLLKLMKHPRGLAKMAVGGARGPRHRPMLGYCVRASAASGWLVYYGEGIHRQTTRAQVRAALGEGPVDALVFGAEPEDARALPELLAGQAAAHVLAFEPHRPWRAAFGLPQLDAAALAATLRAKGLDARPLTAGDTVTLPAAPK